MPIATNLPINDDLAYEIAWRAEPHTYAAYASEGQWLPYDWLVYVGRIVSRALILGNARIIVNAPPRHGKSEFVSHWLPTWLMDNMPHKKVMLTAYGSHFASEWGRKVRNELATNSNCRTLLREDSQSANRWHTPSGGGMITAGIGGDVTGRGGDLLLVDDPHKNWEEAQSKSRRDRVWEFFTGTLYTRLEPGGSIIVLMTRWHPEDLCGRLIEDHSDNWTVIRLPAIAEEGDPMGRSLGQALCRERFTEDDLLNRIRPGVTELPWLASYQQRPRDTASGRVYHHFEPTEYPAGNLLAAPRIDHTLPLDVSMDFNINPGMHLEVGQHFEGLDLITVVHEIHGPRMNVEQAIDKLAEWVDAQGGFKWPELHVFGDATGRAEWAGTSESLWDVVKRKLARLGWPYRIRKPKQNPNPADSVIAYNDALCDMDGVRHYAVSPTCKRLIEDLKRLQTDEDGLIDKREKKLSHASDAERYRIWRIRRTRRVAVSTSDMRVNV